MSTFDEDGVGGAGSAYAQQRLVSESCMDLFLIEMVETICRTTAAETDADSDAMFYKLENMGYAVGQRLVERYIHISGFDTYRYLRRMCSLYIYIRFTKDRPRFADTLDVVKFICKDLWSVMFKKQIDNLKTNHRVRQRSLFSCIHSFSDTATYGNRESMSCRITAFGGSCACRPIWEGQTQPKRRRP